MDHYWIFGLAATFWLAETRYFGWNMRAESETELICDGIVAILLALAFVSRPKREVV